MSLLFDRGGLGIARREEGNVAILFALSAIPLIALLGGAVDFTRYNRYKVELLNAMDSAALALARQPETTQAKADRFVNDYISAMIDWSDPMVLLDAFTTEKTKTGYIVRSDGAMAAAFLPLVGIREMALNLESEVASSTGSFEVALALDNTGSMASGGKIDALRAAAADLVDILYEDSGAADRVKVALIPFVTAVNIKTPGVFTDDWIDRSGKAEYHSFNFAETVDYDALFEGAGTKWKGCVEARQEPYDLEDAAPTGPETRWVPYFWPDEPDRGGSFSNDYLDDQVRGSAWQRQRSVNKYLRNPRLTATIDETPPSTSGPNKSCARPVVELTNDTVRLQDEIAAMTPHYSSGTNIAQGMVWAWHVLSPGEPYTQGAAYDDEKTQKVMVVLTDGRNEVVPSSSMNYSDYTSYGYLARNNGKNAHRLGSRNVDAAVDEVNGKVATLCDSVKGKTIRLYTIVFQVNDQATQDLFRDCASTGEDGQPLYYYAPDNATLATAFRTIGEDLSSLRVAR